jgi:hypothetical protein
MASRHLEFGSREPLWSGAITRRLAGLIPPDRRDEALAAIKAIHTAIFASIGGAILVALSDGVRGRPRRRTAIVGSLIVVETAVYASNNQVCPLTPLAEELGAARGSVVDIFLPAWAARRIPMVAGSAALLALILNARALSRSPAPSRHRLPR